MQKPCAEVCQAYQTCEQAEGIRDNQDNVLMLFEADELCPGSFACYVKEQSDKMLGIHVDLRTPVFPDIERPSW